jgi:hypothetical protein
MAQSMVGLLAAVGAAMSALVGLAHGELVWVIVAGAATATGAAAYLALLPQKKMPQSCSILEQPGPPSATSGARTAS